MNTETFASHSYIEPASQGRLPRRAAVNLIAYGAILWAAAAALAHYLGKVGLLAGPWAPALYLSAVPLLAVFVAPVRRLMRLTQAQVVPAVALATTAALVLDGLAFQWAPWLYGKTPAVVLAAAGLIAWGAGLGQATAFLLTASKEP